MNFEIISLRDFIASGLRLNLVCAVDCSVSQFSRRLQLNTACPNTRATPGGRPVINAVCDFANFECSADNLPPGIIINGGC
ncbi:MAG: hypothetical protein FWG68_09010 [Defluviitaleaceae bacterium]|nr:hypothetical protein [Defluviitaleaceae bacterium]